MHSEIAQLISRQWITSWKSSGLFSAITANSKALLTLDSSLSPKRHLQNVTQLLGKGQRCSTDPREVQQPLLCRSSQNEVVRLPSVNAKGPTSRAAVHGRGVSDVNRPSQVRTLRTQLMLRLHKEHLAGIAFGRPGVSIHAARNPHFSRNLCSPFNSKHASVCCTKSFKRS